MIIDGVVYSSLETYNIVVCRPTAFIGGTTNGRGDDGGTDDPHTLFTVTGDVAVKLYGVCTTLLAGATATLEVGVAGNTAGLIAQTTATDIDANEIWRHNTPAVGIEAIGNIPENIIVNGLDIIETVATADITSLPYKNEVFDAAICTGVLHQVFSLDDYRLAISELARILRKDAIVAVNIFTNVIWDNNYSVVGQEPYTVITKEGLYMTLLNKELFYQLMSNEGLKLETELAENIKQENTGPRAVLRANFVKI